MFQYGGCVMEMERQVWKYLKVGELRKQFQSFLSDKTGVSLVCISC